MDLTNANTAFAALADYAENGLCCSNNGVFKTTDGGTTWTKVTSANGKDATRPWSDVRVDPNTPSIIYAAHGDISVDSTNGVYRSIDSGTTWTLLANAPSGASHVGRIALTVAPSASTTGSHVLYVAIEDNGTSGLYEMLRSDNADAAIPTFTLLSSTPNFVGAQGWYDIVVDVDPANSSSVYVAGVVPNLIERSTDGGAT